MAEKSRFVQRRISDDRCRGEDNFFSLHQRIVFAHQLFLVLLVFAALAKALVVVVRIQEILHVLCTPTPLFTPPFSSSSCGKRAGLLLLRVGNSNFRLGSFYLTILPPALSHSGCQTSCYYERDCVGAVFNEKLGVCDLLTSCKKADMISPKEYLKQIGQESAGDEEPNADQGWLAVSKGERRLAGKDEV